MVTDQTSLNQLFDLAVESTKDVSPGEVFIVKDLFRGFEWNRIAVGNRSKLGSMYYAYAQKEGSDVLNPLGKTPQNQQKYAKMDSI